MVVRHGQALFRQRLPQHRCVALQLLHAPRLLAQQLERRHRGRHGRWRQRGGEDQRARGVDQVLRHLLVAAHVGPVGAERLAEGADDHVDLVLQPRLGHRAAPVRPDRAGAVRLVDHHARVVALRQLDDALQRRDVAIHGEDAIGHDQRPAALRLAQAPLEVVRVAVVVDERLRAREPAAVHDARVVEGVGEDHVALARQRRDHARVRQVAGAEQQAGLGVLEGRQLLLEPPVDRHVARDQPRRARPRAVAHGGLGGRLAHARVIGEAEVVVRAQQQHGLPVEQHARPLRPGHAAHPPVEALVANLVEAVLDVGRHAAGSTWISSG